MRKIALCMELSDFYEHGIARGLVRYAKTKSDWRLYGYGWMFRSLKDLRHWEGDGIIARVEDAASADRLSELGLPVVDVAGAYLRPHFRSVANDDFLTGYKAAIHLLDCGFTRFAYLGVADTMWSEQRLKGFETCLRQRGGKSFGTHLTGNDKNRGRALPAFARSLAWWEKFDDHTGEKELGGFLTDLERPTALFACNDTTGLRATELASRIGIAVPESLAILGVDNEDILCELASPSLSSIMLDCEAIGYRAAAALDAILEGASGGPPELSRLSVPPKDVVERESTRVFACADELVAHAVTFIRNKAHEGIDVSDVLGVVPASRRSLEIRFRAAMGRSPHEEIVRAKLIKAKHRLRDTDATVDRVAEESGFSNLARFHAAFKAAEGVSPGDWRKRNGGR